MARRPIIYITFAYPTKLFNDIRCTTPLYFNNHIVKIITIFTLARTCLATGQIQMASIFWADLPLALGANFDRVP